MQPMKLTVKQLNTYVRSVLEGDSNLASITLVGEISGFKNHYGSGHWYFVLKDADASVRAVMFKGNNMSVRFSPRDGMAVVCRGYVSLYERDGQFQFYAESMQPFGEGDLAAKFEQIKKQLQAEGLFDTARKRALPQFPKRVGVITSDTGAALQDILNVSSRRFPIADLVIFPALVQGEGAPQSLMSALKNAYLQNDLDVIIIGRGGGSAEDLACFNDEGLARLLAESPVPTVSAVGHEVDFTICDFVCDLRAATPSAAAELVFPSADELKNRILFLKNRCNTSVGKLLLNYEERLNDLSSRRCFARPEQLFYPFDVKLETAMDSLLSAFSIFVKNCELEFNKLNYSLEAMSPNEVLKRGYAVVISGDGAVSDSSTLKPGQKVNIRFLKGNATVEVIKTDCE